MTEVESKAPIEKLPEEMLVEIFSKLESDDLQELAKARKDWSTLIVENARTMMKLKLLLDFGQPPHEVFPGNDYFYSVSRYSTIHIENCDVWNKDAMESMKKLGADVHQLELNGCDFNIGSSKMITKTFRSLGKLEVLKMYDVDLDSFEKTSLVGIKPINLDRLKSVVMYESNWGMIEFFKLSQLTSLKISGSLNIDMDGYLFEYLSTQTKLEELALRDMDFSFADLKATQFEKINFPLKKLALNYQHNFMSGEENAKAFLMKFANTLEQLELGSKFENSFYALVFEKMPKLWCLDLSAGGLPEDESFYKTLRNLGSVKKLIVRHYKAKHQKSLEGIIGHSLNIETLIIEGEASQQLMLFISNNLSKLSSLKVQKLAGKLFHNVKMPESLKKVSVDKLGEVSCKDWSQIFRAIPNVEEFSINYVDHELSFNGAKINALTKFWTQLRVLNVGHGFVPEARMFKCLLTRCPKLRTVRIVSSLDYNDPAFKGFKKPGLRLIIANPYSDETPVDGEIDTSLWGREEARNFFDEIGSDSDDSYDGDSNLDMNELDAILFGAIYDSDREDQMYFDSDGEMRYWDEDPSDYGFDYY